MDNPYPWLLAVHFFGLTFWIGGLTFAARLMIVPAGDDAGWRALRLGLANRFLRGAAHPGAALAVLSGAGLIYLRPIWLHAGWLRAKLVLVALLIAADLAFTLRLRRSDESAATQAPIHGIVALLFVLIVVLATVKPF